MSTSVSWLDNLDMNRLRTTDTADLENKLLTEIDERSGELDNVNTADCPQDFATAYLAHKQAWQEFREATKDALDYAQVPSNPSGTPNRDVRPSVNGGTPGPLSDKSRKYSDAITAARDRIRSTYRDCQTLALQRYRIQMP